MLDCEINRQTENFKTQSCSPASSSSPPTLMSTSSSRSVFDTERGHLYYGLSGEDEGENSEKYIIRTHSNEEVIPHLMLPGSDDDGDGYAEVGRSNPQRVMSSAASSYQDSITGLSDEFDEGNDLPPFMIMMDLDENSEGVFRGRTGLLTLPSMERSQFDKGVEEGNQDEEGNDRAQMFTSNVVGVTTTGSIVAPQPLLASVNHLTAPIVTSRRDQDQIPREKTGRTSPKDKMTNVHEPSVSSPDHLSNPRNRSHKRSASNSSMSSFPSHDGSVRSILRNGKGTVKDVTNRSVQSGSSRTPLSDFRVNTPGDHSKMRSHQRVLREKENVSSTHTQGSHRRASSLNHSRSTPADNDESREWGEHHKPEEEKGSHRRVVSFPAQVINEDDNSATMDRKEMLQRKFLEQQRKSQHQQGRCPRRLRDGDPAFIPVFDTSLTQKRRHTSHVRDTNISPLTADFLDRSRLLSQGIHGVAEGELVKKCSSSRKSKSPRRGTWSAGVALASKERRKRSGHGSVVPSGAQSDGSCSSGQDGSFSFAEEHLQALARAGSDPLSSFSGHRDGGKRRTRGGFGRRHTRSRSSPSERMSDIHETLCDDTDFSKWFPKEGVHRGRQRGRTNCGRNRLRNNPPPLEEVDESSFSPLQNYSPLQQKLSCAATDSHVNLKHQWGSSPRTGSDSRSQLEIPKLERSDSRSLDSPGGTAVTVIPSSLSESIGDSTTHSVKSDDDDSIQPNGLYLSKSSSSPEKSLIPPKDFDKKILPYDIDESAVAEGCKCVIL